MSSRALLLLMLIVYPPVVWRAGAESFEHDLSGVRVAALDASKTHRAAAKKVHAKDVSVLSRVADASTWASLLERAQTRPTKVQSTRIGDTTYKIFVVSGKGGVNGQDCPEGTKPENSLFVSKPITGAGKHLYPVRVSVVCRGEAGVRDSFSLNADWDGKILDVALYNGSLGLTVHPLSEPSGPGASEPASLDLFLARLVKQFLDAP